VKVVLPKDLRGVLFSRTLLIELNGFDIDLFLPALFYTILGEGRGRARRTNDAKAIGKYVDRLSQHVELEGFADRDGRRVLERLVRTSLIVTGKVGTAKRGEQILATVPYTLLAHKPGFPTESSRQRNVDAFIYQLLRDRLGGEDSLRKFVKDVFGKGLRLDPPPALGGAYDGKTPLDTLTRLSLAFLDGFDAIGTGLSRSRRARSACPRQAHEFATDLLRYLFTYHTLMSAQALTYNLQALINWELFAYTLKLVHAINALVREPETLPPAVQEDGVGSSPTVYLDFTQGKSGLSREMASACVRRDLEAYQQFLGSNLRLRLLDGYAEKLKRNPTRRAAIEAILPPHDEGPRYLQGLLLLQQNSRCGPFVEALALVDEGRIREANLHGEEEDDPEALRWLDVIVEGAESDVDRVVTLLVEGQQKSALKNFTSWFTGVGGLIKPHGVLQGTVRSRASWRYAPSNDLLAVLVQLAAARAMTDGGASRSSERDGDVGPQPIRLQDFLGFLNQRFGIVVDQPPESFSGADYAAAARDNLGAMLGRLRQMGIFRDLSDDFTVQRLQPPYTSEPTLWRKVRG